MVEGLRNSHKMYGGAALGRAGKTMSGCLRHGVTTWLVGEVILYEILGADVVRIRDKQSGFALLEPVGH
jgi:hypothetical protein